TAARWSRCGSPATASCARGSRRRPSRVGRVSANVGAGAGVMADREERRAAARAAIEAALAGAELEHESPSAGAYVGKLPGERKLWTTCSLVVGDHTLSLNAFVARRPDENHEGVYRWLLERNTRLGMVAFALDHLGDVYLVGRLPLAAVTAEEVDQ